MKIEEIMAHVDHTVLSVDCTEAQICALLDDAIRFGRIGYGEMLRLVENGAQVLHDRSVEMARDHGIEVEVLSAFTGMPGTIVGNLE